MGIFLLKIPIHIWLIIHLEISKELGVTLNSLDSTPNKTKITLPIKGPNPKSKYIINLRNFEASGRLPFLFKLSS